MGREARANQSAKVGPIFLGVPFTKVDADARTVTGLVTDELLDRQGDVVDFETAKAFFTDETLWPGNIREQHDPKKPVGSKVNAVVDEAAKTVNLTAYVSEACPDTWTKCVDGTLKGFSIGGAGRRVVEKVGDKVIKRLFLESLAEVSLVDNPANPRALFTVAKSVDGQVQLVEPAEGTEVADPAEKATALLDAELEKAKDDGEKNKTASGQEGKWYAGTDGKSFPISTAKDVSNAARALGRTNQDKAKVKANIIRIAYAHGLDSGLPDAWKKKSDQKGAEKVQKWGYGMPLMDDGECCPEPYDVQSILSAIAVLEQTLASEMTEPGEDGDEDKAQLNALRAAVMASIEFLQSEFEEQFADDGEEDDAAKAAHAELRKTVRVQLAADLFCATLPVLKAGARHSKNDVSMIQKVHDLSNSLGANCNTDNAADGDDMKKRIDPVDVEKAKAKDDEKDAKDCKTCKGTGKIMEGNRKCPDCKGSGDEADGADKSVSVVAIEKLAAEFETLKADHDALKATVSEKDKTIASQEDRLKLLEQAPAGGGPVRSAHAVDKSLGGPTDDPQAPSPDSVVKSLQAIAEGSDDPVVKRAAAAELIKVQRRLGTSVISSRR